MRRQVPRIGAVTPHAAVVGRFSRAGETWSNITDRVANTLGRNHSEVRDIRVAMTSAEIVPAGQILRGAGHAKSVLYNCFVTGADPEEGAQDVAARFAAWTARGAGVGANVSAWCRARGDEGLRLHEVVNAVARAQQHLWETGITRTATMLNVDFGVRGVADVCSRLAHDPTYRHLNLGIVVANSAMQAAVDAWRLGEPGVERGELESLAAVAWRTGNPGLVFKDAVNRNHPFDEVVDACNPCAEQHLVPDEGCNLASINLASLVKADGFDIARFREVVRIGVRMLDATIDASDFPCSAARNFAVYRRRIGLGVTGFASALQALGVEYDSEDAVACAKEWATELQAAALDESKNLAQTAGSFGGSNATHGGRRHAYLTSIAPAGAISLLWGVSSGIEPIFAPRYKKGEFDVRTQDDRIQCAYDIPGHQHLRVAASWQHQVDGGISKTVNLPEHSTVDDIIEVFIDAWLQGCKGVSVFRNGSRQASLIIQPTRTSQTRAWRAR